MQPMAERLGVDHQRLQQFITSSTWDYVAVRRNVARWFAASQPVEALVVDDTGFPKDGTASPCVARQYSGTLGKTGNCQVAVSVHLVNEHASCAADWRLFCPEAGMTPRWPIRSRRPGPRRRRERAGIPDRVRHTEKWRLALEMIDEMTGPGGWGVLDADHRRRRRPAGRDRRCRLRRQHRLPAGAGCPRLAVRGRGQGHHQRLRRRRAAGDAHPGRRARPAAQARLPRARRRTCASSPSPARTRSSR